ncbi:hypothetical protein TWF703_005160 [Orbilia oligospora]|uniref:Aminoglycoside phosphotransferase domain-containing protein n=1 Tax=Orbilia oligospora TaxID=2813651 RepID=A0A7C8P7E6_ORBOL|nr:hypothetical protein TWF703_005160 [Orbilia oligospora]
MQSHSLVTRLMQSYEEIQHKSQHKIIECPASLELVAQLQTTVEGSIRKRYQQVRFVSLINKLFEGLATLILQVCLHANKTLRFGLRRRQAHVQSFVDHGLRKPGLISHVETVSGGPMGEQISLMVERTSFVVSRAVVLFIIDHYDVYNAGVKYIGLDVIEWQSGLFGSQPVWKVEPSIDIVTGIMRSKIQEISQHEESNEDSMPTATFLGGGAFNKLYLMNWYKSSWILRLTLPADPYYKTVSEAATINLIRTSTSLPVPEIITHYSGGVEGLPNDGNLGLEWILMTKLPGKNLRNAWYEMDIGIKMRFVELLADKLHELYACEAARFSTIGNVYQSYVQADPSRPRAPPGSTTYTVGRIVSMPFFWKERLYDPVERGPFPSSEGWFASRLQLVDHECTQIIDSDSSDPDDKEDAIRFRNLSRRLSQHIQTFLPTNEKFVLHHDDINAGNLLVDPETGALTGILDWECVPVLPTWKSCQLPLFLMNTKARNMQPSEKAYLEREDGPPSSLYFEHLREWELTMLGQCFLQRMESHNSDWMEVYRSSERVRDFDFAIQHCDSEFMVKRIEEWLDIVERGEQYQRLLEYN